MIDPWFEKAEGHMTSSEICLNLDDYSSVINFCFLAMFSVIKALLILKDTDCKTHEGLIYLFKINYVDNGLFDREMFRFYCKTKELHTEFFRVNFDVFTEDLARETLDKTKIFIDYSKSLI